MWCPVFRGRRHEIQTWIADYTSIPFAHLGSEIRDTEPIGASLAHEGV